MIEFLVSRGPPSTPYTTGWLVAFAIGTTLACGRFWWKRPRSLESWVVLGVAAIAWGFVGADLL